MSYKKRKKKTAEPEINLEDLDKMDPDEIRFSALNIPYCSINPTFDRFLNATDRFEANSTNELDTKIQKASFYLINLFKF